MRTDFARVTYRRINLCRFGNTAGRARLALILLVAPVQSFSQSLPLAAIVANQTIDWNGWTVMVDSFNSSDPASSVLGLYNPSRARDNGNVVAGGSISDSIGIGTANIYGHVQVGIGSGAQVGALGGIGSRDWQTKHPGEIEPGWLTQGGFTSPPEVTLPYSSGLDPAPGDVISTNCSNGVDCKVYTNHYDHVLYAGDYFSLNLSGSTLVLGAARVVVPNGLQMGGNDEINVAPGGSVTVFAATNSSIGGNGIINQSGLARSFKFFGTPAMTALALGFSREFIGVIVAPDAAVQLDGAGTNFNAYVGSLVTKSLKFNGNFDIHFDESLVPTPLHLDSPSLASGVFQFSVGGGPGSHYVVKASTNLLDWVSLLTNASPFTFSDQGAANLPGRYYRALSAP